MPTYHVDVTVKLSIEAKDKSDLDHIINEMDYDFKDTVGGGRAIVDMHIEDYEVSFVVGGEKEEGEDA